MIKKPSYSELEKRIQELEQAVSEQNQTDEALEKQVVTLPHLLKDDEYIAFEDMFNIDDIQRLQDEFAQATGLASIITYPDGEPITAPSNFCRLCKDIIRKTGKGLANCFRSDAVIGRLHLEGPIVQRCISGGLWDAGAGITAGGRHIANWLIGQVRDEAQSKEQMLEYAREIGASEKDVVEAFHEVTAMSREQFESIAKVLFTLANQLSATAYQNVQQARFIAERTQIEQALKESEERFRYLSDASMEAIFFIKKGFCLEANQVAADIFGYEDRSEFIGKFGTDIIAPESHSIVKKNMLTDTFEPYEAIGMRKNGTRFPISIKGKAMPYKDEGSVRVTSIADITERKHAEEALKRSESIHTKMVANIGDVIVIADQKGITRYKSANVKKLFGWEPEELVGASTWDNIHPDDLKSVQKFFGEIMRKPDTFKAMECRYRCKDSSYRWIELKGTNLSHDPDIRGFLGHYHDIAERKKTEASLQESEKEFRSTLNNTLTGVVVHTGDTRILFSNLEATKILGLTYDQMSGKEAIDPEWNFVHENLSVMQVEDYPVSKVLSTKKPIHDFSFGIKRPDRKDITWVIVKAIPLFSIDGEVEKVIVNFIDYTDRKQAEKERKKLESQLRQSQKMESIGTLAGGIAHDFNNILFPIVGYTEMLLEDVPEGSPFSESLEEIFTGAMRAKDLVKQILTFSRQESREFKLLKIQPIIAEAMKLIRSTIPTTIKISQDIRNDCGAINANPTEIHQIVMNLATNAYHAMESIGGELTVNLKEMTFGEQDVIGLDVKPGVYACLTMADTGVGMNKNTIDKAFDPFFTTKTLGKGTGMGLSVIHGIIKHTGGSITVYSEIGKGTEFRVYLPVVERSAEQYSPETREVIQGGTEQILIVDDENAILNMEKRILERLGYQIVTCNSSLEALETFRATPNEFDVVITDMAMPNMSGDKLAIELIKLRSDIPILLCTGFSEHIPEAKALSMGIKGFLMKPVVLADLSRKIREVLDD